MAASVLGLNRSQISRYRTGKTRIPKPLEMLLKVFAGEVVTDARYSYFRGWRFNGDKLFTPNGTGFTENDIRAIPLYESSIMTLERDVRAYKSEIEALKMRINELESVERDTLPDNVIRLRR
jgi:transcriptional regulator with XRE-family HTH domain